MIRAELARAVVDELDSLIATHSLPVDTRERVARSVRPLARSPQLGPELGGRWSGYRFVLGPWRWMIILYVYLDEEDRVVIVSVHDGRSSRSARTG